MLLLNIEYIPGKKIEALGIAKGSVVQSKNFGKDFMAGMKTLVGGEIELHPDAHRGPADRHQAHGGRRGGHGGGRGHRHPLHLRLRHAGAAEITAYGTAVRIAGEA